ncbi:Condensin-2 complex subunit D3 [Biomphalaria glabrata]|nr:condensin-2 complex subunit D3-like [Biomphalaria glabrata]
MADANKTIAVFENLELNVLQEDYVKTCWDEDFADFSSIPVDVKEHLEEKGFLTDQLQAAHDMLGTWLQFNNENDNGEGFWSILIECDISHKSLVVLLAYLSHNASKISASFSEKAAGILASSVYLRLISLPGSAAFKIYNPELFLQACRVLTIRNRPDNGGGSSKRKKKRDIPSGNKRQTKRRKGTKIPSGEALFEEDSGTIRDGSDEEQFIELSETERDQIDDFKKSLLQNVVIICERYSLRQSESTAIQLLSVLTNIVKEDPLAIDETMGQWNARHCSPGMLAFKAMYLLCQPFHGHVTTIVNESFKQLLEQILMMEDGKLFTALARPVLQIRRHALDFVVYVVKELGERSVNCLKTLLQTLCFKVPDKSDYRAYAAEAVCELVDYLPDIEYARMLEWLKRLSRYTKATQRSFLVDVMLTLIEKPERRLSDAVPSELSGFCSHKSMVLTLLSKCSDSNASIRSRALTGFSVCTSSKFRDVVSTIKEVITPIASRPTAKHFMPTPVAVLATAKENPTTPEVMNNSSIESSLVPDNKQTENGDGDSVAQNQLKAQTPQTCALQLIEITPGFNPYLPDTEGVISMFHRRMHDSKVVVRKCALQALEKVVELVAPCYRKEDLQVLQERCADPALSVRKQAVQSLFELLKAFPKDQNIQKAWIFGLLPQVMDRETSVQEKSFEFLEEMILQHLKPANRTQASTGIEWDLLRIIVDESCEKLRRYLQKACQYWARTKKLKSSMIDALLSHIHGDNDKAAWMFLAEISKTPVKINHSLVIQYWKTVTTCADEASCGKWFDVLTVLGSTVKFIPNSELPVIFEDMKQRLREFTYPPGIIAGMVHCVSKLYACLEMSRRLPQAWGEDILRDCDQYMSHVILTDDKDTVIDEEKLICYMFTLGEVCQRCPTRMPKRVTLLIQSIIASPCISAIGESQQPSNEASDGSHSSDGSHDLLRSPSSQASSQASQPLSQFKGSRMSNNLRVHAFITLGKLCLVDETLAKKTIAALARELEVSECPAIRNNVVVVLGDLTIRYTTLVDRYATNIASCLKDPSAIVRKNTLTILTRLLQEEYVKWKGVLFFYYITTLIDENQEIKDLAAFCLEHLLLQKHPNMFFHPFIECIFHFNSYHNHPVYNKFKQTEGEKKKFSLAGASNFKKRMQLYTFMLEHMTDEQRFKITAKTNKEILSAVVDKVIPLDAEGSQILIDALAILSSREIKLSTLRGKGSEETPDETTIDLAKVVTATAKKVLITQVVRRNVIENIVPVVITLKHMLEKCRSPILKNLMAYLRELMKDYKTEIKDILAADRQLAEEIEFDLRNFEKDSQPKTPSGNTPQSNTPVGSRESSRPASPLVHANLSAQPAVLREHNGTPCRSGRSSPMELNQSRISVVTMLDAAKKAMSRVDQLRQSGNNFKPLKSATNANSTASKVSTKCSKSIVTQDSDSENTLVSPTTRFSQLRAISTPSKDVNNVTFAQVGNMTMIPPSPIPSVASVMSAGKLCLSPMMKVQQKGKKNIIHMPHPEAKDPEPIKWNIKSPTKQVTSTSPKDGTSTPSRKSHAKSAAGMRRSNRTRQK